MKKFICKYGYDLALLPGGVLGYVLGTFGFMFTQNVGLCIVTGCAGALAAQLAFVIRVPEDVFKKRFARDDENA